ncbi:MAG: D-amino acid aminotransferase [Gammaproteobacteria bacterium]|nr:D-amino acid aminotransferase [Gammaproteobacteria bacterium]
MNDNEQIVYLNGEFKVISEASVSVLDRGFLFGDGVYEVIPAYGGRLLRLDSHLQRLQNSLDGIRLENPLSSSQWVNILNNLIEKNQGQDQSLYLQVTRGVAAQRNHNFPDQVKATVFAMSNELHPMPRSTAEQGIEAVTLDDIRWHACNIKSTALLANTLLKQQATDKGAGEAILIRDGFATEGSASNIFIVLDGVIITPPTGPLLLPGITRDLVLELARTHDMPCQERDIKESELRNANEIWITSSTREVVPVLKLDGEIVGDGVAGSVWQHMIDIYQQYKQQLRDDVS